MSLMVQVTFSDEVARHGRIPVSRFFQNAFYSKGKKAHNERVPSPDKPRGAAMSIRLTITGMLQVGDSEAQV